MAKKNNIAMKTWSKIIPEYGTSTMTLGEGDNAFEVIVQQHLDVVKRAELVETIADLVYGDSYRPYMRELAQGYAVLKGYTNLDMNCGPQPVYELLRTANVYDHILTLIDDDVFSMFEEADVEIEWRKNQYLQKCTLDGVVNVLNKCYDDIKDGLEKIKNRNAGDNITSEDVKNLVNALNNKSATQIAKEMLLEDNK